MHVQKTWEAILNTPLELDDVLVGEWLWAASKSVLSGLAILAVIWALGLQADWLLTLWIIPLAFIIGLCFSGMGLVMTSISPNYDFFLYYFTLAITPMVLLCGVFYPVSQLPPLLQTISAWLPLSHAVELARPIIRGDIPANWAFHIFSLLAWGFAGFWLALGLTRRRLLK